MNLKTRLVFTMLSACAALNFQSCNTTSSSQASEEKLPEQVSYNFDIRPILSDKCLACHGPDANKREAGLRLDDPEAAFKALQENPKAHALVAGKPELSQAYLRITTEDTALKMPPPASNLKLSQREVDLIEKWIKQGAKYEKHWAFVAPKKPTIPEIDHEEWPKNEIDHFILEKHTNGSDRAQRKRVYDARRSKRRTASIGWLARNVKPGR